MNVHPSYCIDRSTSLGIIACNIACQTNASYIIANLCVYIKTIRPVLLGINVNCVRYVCINAAIVCVNRLLTVSYSNVLALLGIAHINSVYTNIHS